TRIVLISCTAILNTLILSLHDALPIFRIDAADRHDRAGTAREKFRRRGANRRAGGNLALSDARAAGIRLDHPSFRRPFGGCGRRSEEHTSELQSLAYLVCRLLLEKKKF